MNDYNRELARGGWKQRSRYLQEPENAHRMRFQPRDGEIIEAVRRFRYISTQGLLKLFAPDGRGEKALRRRLAILFHNQYLTRRYLHPMERPIGIGSSKAIYILDEKAAVYLWGDGWKGSKEGKKLIRRKSFGYRHLKHSLAISEFQLVLHLAISSRPDASLESFTPDMEDADMKVEVRIPRYRVRSGEVEKLGGLEKVTVWPDASFSIVASKKRYFYFLEVDQADRKRERIFKRFLAYWRYVVGDRCKLRKKRGVSGAFVVFVAPSAKRRDVLIEIANQVPEVRKKRPGFWFIDQSEVSLDCPTRLLKDPVAYGLDGKPGFLTKFL
jgi:hypothetical protein